MKAELFAELMESVTEALDHAKGQRNFVRRCFRPPLSQ